jgi:spermidine synthase
MRFTAWFRCLVVGGLLLLPGLTAAAQWRTLLEQRSEFNGRVIVRESATGLRQLVFDDGSATQSAVNTDNPGELVLSYSRHIMAALPLVPQAKRVLVVGLGGGSMQRYMRGLLPNLIIDTVEIDPIIPDIAKRFFYFVEDEKNRIFVDDGRRFIERGGQPYDIIFLDAFGPQSIPYALATQEFLRSVRGRLAPGGIAVANLWYDEPNYHNMVKTYASVFAEVAVLRCAASGNNILIAFPEKVGLTTAQWVEKARAFEKDHPTGLSLPDLIDRGALAVRIPEDARILLDKDEPRQR